MRYWTEYAPKGPSGAQESKHVENLGTKQKSGKGFCIFGLNEHPSNIMETLILKLDMRSKSAQVLKELITEMSRANKGIKLEKSPYDPEFVKMVKASSSSKNRTEIDPENVWASIQ